MGKGLSRLHTGWVKALITPVTPDGSKPETASSVFCALSPTSCPNITAKWFNAYCRSTQRRASGLGKWESDLPHDLGRGISPERTDEFIHPELCCLSRLVTGISSRIALRSQLYRSFDVLVFRKHPGSASRHDV